MDKKISEATKEMVDIQQCFKRVFDSPDGKKVLHYLVKRSNFMRNSPLNALALAHNEGKRTMVRGILELVHVNPDDIIKTMEETDYEDLIL